MINHIQNKTFCVHNICVHCVIFIMYIYIYKYTHMHIQYMFKKIVVYILNVFIYIKLYYIHKTCKYFRNIYCMCVCLYIYSLHTNSTHTYIMFTKTLFWM